MLSVEELVIGYGTTRVAGPLDVQLAAGEFACLLGPNGSGKSTLLRTLAAMQPPLAGRLRIGDDDVAGLSALERARCIAIVLTERPATGLLRARELVELGRLPHTDWSGRLRDEDHAAVDAALGAVGAQQFANRYVADLSDGERQRIWLARALAQQPKVILLDEVLAFLDLPGRVQTMHLLRRIAREQNLAVLLSCHDLELALHAADKLWIHLPGGQLRAGNAQAIIADGSLQLAFEQKGVRYDTATSRFVVHEGEAA